MPAPVVPAALCKLLQFLALLFCEIGSHLPMRLGHDLMDAQASVPSHLLELRGRFIDNRRNFGDLFRRQIELRAKPFLYSGAYQFGMVKFREKMPSVHSPKKSAGDPPGEEYEDKSRNEFPLQRAVHLKNSSWIAESAIANSFVRESPNCS
jgi:hypothetical protein